VHVFDSLTGQLLHTIDTEGHKFVLSLDFVSMHVQDFVDKSRRPDL
jgi:hypothetical protein